MALLDTTQCLTLEVAEGKDGPGTSEPEPFVTSINFFEANKPETHHAPLGTLWDLRLPVLTRAHGLRTQASCVLYVLQGTGQLATGEGTSAYAHQPRACRTYRVPCGAPQATARVHAAHGGARPHE